MSRILNTVLAAGLAIQPNMVAQKASLEPNIGKTCQQTLDATPAKVVRQIADKNQFSGDKASIRAQLLQSCEAIAARNEAAQKKYAPAAKLLQEIVYTIGESEISPNVDESIFKKPFNKVAFEKAVNDFVDSGAHLLVYNHAHESLANKGLERRPAADLSTALGNATSPNRNFIREPRKELSGSDSILYLLRALNRFGIDIADERYPAIEAMKEKLEAMKTMLRAGIAKLECGKPQPETPKQGGRGPRVSKDWLAEVCPAGTGAAR